MITVVDDVPEADIDLGEGSVLHDETPGDDGDDDTNSSSVKARFAVLEGTGQTGDDPDVSGDSNGVVLGNGAIGYAHDDSDVVEDDSIIGADAPASVRQFTLTVLNANSGLETTDGSDVLLEAYDNGTPGDPTDDLVIGRVSGGTFNGKIAFAVHIDQDGEISVAQYLSLRHPIFPNDHDEEINLGNSIGATLTVIDSDGDTDTDTVAIGTRIRFDDDGPEVDAKLVSGAHVIHDETPGVDDPDDDVPTTPALLTLFAGVNPTGDDPHVADNPIGFAQSAGSILQITTADYGADGPGSALSYSLVLDGNNVHSGLETTDGRDIHLFKEGNIIVGRYDAPGDGNDDITGSDPAAFAIHIDPATGQITIVQWVSLNHPDEDNHDDTVTLDDDTLVRQGDDHRRRPGHRFRRRRHRQGDPVRGRRTGDPRRHAECDVPARP